jgi:6-pyruvoyltetrahydropterin/6-carboxytetrahydropterin synthase
VQSPYRIEITRELFKFSCAHMTVFPDGSKERLHGHNYFVGVAVDLSDISFARMVPFAPIQEAVRALCSSWKEHLLLAEHNPFFEIVRDSDGELEFRLCGQRYLLPRRDALLLPIDNVAVEPLSAHVADILIGQLGDLLRDGQVRGLEVRVTESPGQGAVCYRELG